MSAWRRRALEAFPDHGTEIRAPQLTLHQLFFEMGQWCRDAHAAGDRELLSRIYSYAEWCFRLPDRSAANAAAVSFYEHLGDSRATLSAMPEWVPKDVFADVASLLEYRVGGAALADVRAAYAKMR